MAARRFLRMLADAGSMYDEDEPFGTSGVPDRVGPMLVPRKDSLDMGTLASLIAWSHPPNFRVALWSSVKRC